MIWKQAFVLMLSCLYSSTFASTSSSASQSNMSSALSSSFPRQLQAQEYSIKFRYLPDSYDNPTYPEFTFYEDLTFSFSLQEPCYLLPYYYYCIPKPGQSQIPTPIRKTISFQQENNLIHEYKNYFESTIVLIIYQLIPGGAKEMIFPQLNFNGAPFWNNYKFAKGRFPGYISSYFWGFIKAQMTGSFNLKINCLGDCVFWLNDVKYYSNEEPASITPINMMIDEYLFFNATLNNSQGQEYGLELSWDWGLTGTFEEIPLEYLYYPSSYLFGDSFVGLKENYYCDITDVFACQAHGWLCTVWKYDSVTNTINCSDCVAEATLKNGACYCNNGYSVDNISEDQCFKCNDLCLTCYLESYEEESICKTCVENAVLQEGHCVCSEGYYHPTEDPSLNTCIPCEGLCKTCSSSATICLSCLSESSMTLENNICSCKSGYYQVEKSCILCQGLCETCSASDACLTCKPHSNNLADSNVCVCNDGLDLNSIGDGCINPSCPDLCNDCDISDICSSCTTHATVSGGLCSCDAKYYKSGNSCLDCPKLCSICNDGSTCGGCTDNAKIMNNLCECLFSFEEVTNLDGLIECECPDTHRFVSSSDEGCYECDPRKKQNPNNPYECICKDINAVSETDCACKPGFFYGSDTLGCVAIPENCELDTTAADDVSIKGKIGYYYIPDSFSHDRVYDGVCSDCNSNCDICASFTDCTTCESGFELEESGAYCICPLSSAYIVINGVSFCIACPTNMVRNSLNSGECVCILDHYLVSDMEGCLPCPEFAEQDTYNAKKCICKSGFSRQDELNPNSDNCQCSNINQFYDGSVCADIPLGCERSANDHTQYNPKNGYYKLGDECHACSDSLCLRCEQNDTNQNCIECVEYAELKDGICGCKAGYADMINLPGRCIPCSDQFCDICSRDDIEICEKCADGFELKDGKCNCEDGYYAYSRECLECTGLCETCNSIGDEIKCISCKPNSKLDNGECICEDGYYLPEAGFRSCYECRGLCDSCYISAYTYRCKTCLPNSKLESEQVCMCEYGYYHPSAESRQCLECTGLCESCYYLDEELKCSTCLPKSKLENGKCFCEYGYYHTSAESRECLECTGLCESCYYLDEGLKCSTCLPNSKLENEQCICEYGYYKISAESRECLECTGLCESCYFTEEGLKCSTCLPNSKLENGQCICEYGLYIQSDNPRICSLCDEKSIALCIKSSLWNYDMLSFDIYFNNQIRASTGGNECEIYFNEVTLKELGDNPICEFDSSQKILSVNIGSHAKIIEGPIQFKQSSVQSEHIPNLFLDSSIDYYIEVPSKFPEPQALMEAPSKISSCSKILIDGSQSYVNGRDFVTKWYLTSGTVGKQLEKYNGRLKIEINADMIKDISLIQIQLEVTNFFNKTSISAANIKIVPEIRFLSDTYVEIARSLDYYARIDIEWPTCYEKPNNFTYEWSISEKDTSTLSDLNLSGNQIVKVPANTLDVSTTYLLKVKVIPDQLEQNAEEGELTMTVKQSPIVVTIKGGNREADISKVLILYGYESYDPDEIDSSNLQYEWEYYQNSSSSHIIKLDKYANCTVKAKTLQPNEEYIFTLTVSSSIKSSKSSVYIKTTRKKIPVVYLFSQTLLLNPSKTSIIQSNINNTAYNSYSLEWKVSGGNYNFTSPDNQRSISIKPNSLEPGKYYTFTLEYTLNSIRTYSTLEVYVNNPPSYGEFKITPDEGTSLDKFYFDAGEWIDSEYNYPLQYQIHKQNNEDLVELSGMSYSSIFQTILSPGIDDNQHINTYVLYVYDSLGAYSQKYANATVKPLSYENALERSENIVAYYKNNLESIESMRSIPSILIEISDNIQNSITTSRDISAEGDIVYGSLDVLGYYCDQMLKTEIEATSTISALERITSNPLAVSEASRNTTFQILYKAVDVMIDNFIEDAVYATLNIVENLYLANNLDIQTSESTKNKDKLHYFEFMDKLGPIVLRDQIVNQEPIMINTELFNIIYQRVSTDKFTVVFEEGKPGMKFPDNIVGILMSYNLSPRDALDISQIYSKDKLYANSTEESIGVMYISITKSGYEDEYGVVLRTDPENISLNNLEDPIGIYLQYENINITERVLNCTYLDEFSYEWDTQGCRLKDEIPENKTIICECNHMSFYSASEFKEDHDDAINSLNIEKFDKNPLEANIENTYALVIVLSLIIMLHAILAYSINLKENKESKRRTQIQPTNLDENQPRFGPYIEEAKIEVIQNTSRRENDCLKNENVKNEDYEEEPKRRINIQPNIQDEDQQRFRPYIEEAKIEVIQTTSPMKSHSLQNQNVENEDYEEESKRRTQVLQTKLDEDQPGSKPYSQEVISHYDIDVEVALNNSPSENHSLKNENVKNADYKAKKSKTIYAEELEGKNKTFLQMYLMSNSILELVYVVDRRLSKLKRLNLLFYSIYANIFLMGLLYSRENDHNFTDQVTQIQEALSFEGKDVILFIYSRAIVIIPYRLMRWMLISNTSTSKRSFKNKLGTFLLLIGYLGFSMGIYMLGISFKVNFI